MTLAKGQPATDVAQAKRLPFSWQSEHPKTPLRAKKSTPNRAMLLLPIRAVATEHQGGTLVGSQVEIIWTGAEQLWLPSAQSFLKPLMGYVNGV